ncbi:MAG: hypothetical protein ACOH10_13785 [Rhodoglobus sp.]
MTTAQIRTDTLLADLNARTLSGLLVPFGVQGNTNLGKFTVEAGSLTLPRDPSVVTLNSDHDRETPIGRATMLAEEADGIHVTFSFADTEEADAALLAHEAGTKSALSVEAKNIVIRAGKAISGFIFGAAHVTKGAFPGATLLASDVGDVLLADSTEEVISTYTGDDGYTYKTTRTSEFKTEDNKTTETTVVVTETESDEDAKKEDDVTVATVPDTLTAAATTAPATTIADIANALALFAGSSDRSGINRLMAEQADYQNTSLYAALSDIKTGGVGANFIQPQWIGELWRGRSFERRIIPLLAQAALTSNKIKGFKWLVEPTMAAWAGDKANVPSNTPTTEAYELTALKYAGGHDIAREFYDFPNPEFWAAYFAAMTDSYAKLTDDAALTALLAGATPVTAGAVPAGVSSGLVSIVDGALAVLPTGAPSFAVVAPDVFRSIALTKENDKLAFLNTSLGLEEGTLTSFRVVPHTGIAAGKALVGVSAAATFYELPGAAPIRTEALDQIKGGIDEALFGYAVTGVNRPAGLALVTAGV